MPFPFTQWKFVLENQTNFIVCLKLSVLVYWEFWAAFYLAIWTFPKTGITKNNKKNKQAGAELGQAQPWLGLEARILYWGLKLKFDGVDCNCSLKFEFDIDVWIWRGNLELKFEVDVWSWSLKKLEVDTWSWSFKLKFEVKIWGCRL